MQRRGKFAALRANARHQKPKLGRGGAHLRQRRHVGGAHHQPNVVVLRPCRRAARHLHVERLASGGQQLQVAGAGVGCFAKHKHAALGARSERRN